MSADLMLVCYNRNENFEGNSEKCCFVDETSMGCPHTDFGKLLSQYEFNEIDDGLIKKVIGWYDQLDHKDGADIDEIKDWLLNHKGEDINLERW